MNIKCFYPRIMWLGLLLLYSTMIHGQQSLNIIDLYSDIFLSKKARTILEKANVGDRLFHGRIGGVAFESVAIPSKTIENSKISLDFESDRFSITIDNQNIYPDIPDWQLIPTVLFVNSPYQVLFSSSGDTIGNQEAQCRYHPAFLNTLAGLRIFQVDLLNLPGLLWDLPKDDKGSYLLATSETPFTPVKKTAIEKTLYDVLSGNGRPFSSFVLTDKNANIGFDIQGRQIRFSGHPYYLFTKNEGDMEHVNILRKELEQTYADIENNAKIFLGSKYTSNLNPKTNLGGLLNVLKANRKDEVYNPYAMRNVISAISRLDSLNTLSDAQIGIKFAVLNQYSISFNENNWELLKEYNPPVYSAIENIAQWAAFFRYVKKTNPVNWSNFVEKISGRSVKDAPVIDTPTAYEINYFKLIDEQQKK